MESLSLFHSVDRFPLQVAGLTPMGLACAGGHLATVRLLLQWGAIFEGLNEEGAR